MNAEEQLVKLTNKLATSDNTNNHLSNQITNTKNLITTLFTESQNLILSSYFNKAINDIKTIEHIETFRKKIYNYKSLIGISDNDNFYNTFYLNIMEQLDAKQAFIENGALNSDTSMITVKENFFTTFVKKLKTLFTKSNERKKAKINIKK